MSKLEWAFLVWMTILTTALATTMAITLGFYINDYFCW